MHRPYSRDYEWELMLKIRDAGVSDETIVSEFLSYFSSDDTCAALESICDDYDIEYEEDEE